jgi:SNF family Na+-dependent transporter
MMVVSFLCTVYYNVIIAWCLYYLSQSLRSEVPWKNCDNWWNTDKCATTGRLEYDVSTCDLIFSLYGSIILLRVSQFPPFWGYSPLSVVANGRGVR